jgi:hypothetical protein
MKLPCKTIGLALALSRPIREIVRGLRGHRCNCIGMQSEVNQGPRPYPSAPQSNGSCGMARNQYTTLRLASTIFESMYPIAVGFSTSRFFTSALFGRAFGGCPRPVKMIFDQYAFI